MCTAADQCNLDYVSGEIDIQDGYNKVIIYNYINIQFESAVFPIVLEIKELTKGMVYDQQHHN